MSKRGLSTDGKKHECVKRLIDKTGHTKLPPLVEYDGDILCIPNSVTEIVKLSVYRLREILRFHNVLDCGTKDELVVRVGMVREGRAYLAFHRELEAISNLVNAIRAIIAEERHVNLGNPTVIYKRRRFATALAPSVGTKRPRDNASITHQWEHAFLPVPDGLTFDNLERVLDPLSDELAIYQQRHHH